MMKSCSTTKAVFFTCMMKRLMTCTSTGIFSFLVGLDLDLELYHVQVLNQQQRIEAMIKSCSTTKAVFFTCMMKRLMTCTSTGIFSFLVGLYLDLELYHVQVLNQQQRIEAMIKSCTTTKAIFFMRMMKRLMTCTSTGILSLKLSNWCYGYLAWPARTLMPALCTGHTVLCGLSGTSLHGMT